MRQDMRDLLENPGSFGINGWTDYQLLRLLRCYDTWSATPSQCSDFDHAAPDRE
ncbi:MAG: hypothetical protein MJE12_19620 [Alphaproteobacteria bacterium]|nr:hypothetical protein [Alphaproteobacteria bacterium]